MHVYFSLDALKGLGQCLEQLQPLTKVCDSFHIGGALAGSLSSLVPITDRLCVETCLSVVMCQQFRLSFSGLWKQRFEHLRDALVVLLPRAFQQGLIGGVLN